jgi:hypothetical protein
VTQAIAAAEDRFAKLKTLADWCRFRCSLQLGHTCRSRHFSVSGSVLLQQRRQVMAVWTELQRRRAEGTTCKFAGSRRGRPRLRRMCGYPAVEKGIRQRASLLCSSFATQRTALLVALQSNIATTSRQTRAARRDHDQQCARQRASSSSIKSNCPRVWSAARTAQRTQQSDRRRLLH